MSVEEAAMDAGGQDAPIPGVDYRRPDLSKPDYPRRLASPSASRSGWWHGAAAGREQPVYAFYARGCSRRYWLTYLLIIY